MATKRMFSKDIVRTDRFLDMSLSTQALYFHLCLDADVKGFVSPRSIMRLINATNDDLTVLITKGFIIPFESGVIVVRDWHVHNYIQEEREAKSQYMTEYSQLELQPQGNYQLLENSESTLKQIRLDKIRLEQINNVPPKGDTTPQQFIDSFNSLLKRNFKLTKGRENKLRLRLKSYSLEEVLKALANMASDPFYSGTNDRGWCADPDFLLRSDEQIDKFLNKVLESKVNKLQPWETYAPDGSIVRKD